MIQINERYRILGTDTDYKAEYLVEATDRRKKEQGEKWALVGYYDSVERAINAIIDEEYRRRLQVNTYDLGSALEEFKNVRREFAELLRRATIAEIPR